MEDVQETADRDESLMIVRWRVALRRRIEGHVATEHLQVTWLPILPRYEVPPHLGLWLARPDTWLIGGSVPIDHCVMPKTTPVRTVLRLFAARWRKTSLELMAQDASAVAGGLGFDNLSGVSDPNIGARLRELGEQLHQRATIIDSIAKNDELW